jgi:TrmH family RNA methyltransferase
MVITSSSNSKVKQVIRWRDKAKERRRDGIFIAEGTKMFEEAPDERIVEVYVSESIQNKLTQMSGTQIADKLKRHEYFVIKDDIFEKMSDTQTPQGIITIVRRMEYDVEEIISADNPLIVILENLKDPGNLGTIIRTGEGAGVTGVILNTGTVDIYNPKTIRSTMGSIFRVPVACTDNPEELVGRMHEKGIHTYAAHLKGEVFYDSFSFEKPTAFLIGNEGNGLSDELAGNAEHYLKIPMEGKVESLNAAVAASLLMYEAHRQRSK